MTLGEPVLPLWPHLVAGSLSGGKSGKSCFRDPPGITREGRLSKARPFPEILLGFSKNIAFIF